MKLLIKVINRNEFMDIAELNSYLNFVRKSISDLKEQINVLEGGNWNRNVRGDYDKEILYSNLKEILTRYQNLLRRNYECEK